VWLASRSDESIGKMGLAPHREVAARLVRPQRQPNLCGSWGHPLKDGDPGLALAAKRITLRASSVVFEAAVRKWANPPPGGVLVHAASITFGSSDALRSGPLMRERAQVSKSSSV
jgi:hypothetical protein